jgi:signal transduction histidine kinase/HAMP domain-containing protein
MFLFGKRFFAAANRGYQFLMLKFLANLRSRLILLILLAVVPAFGLILDSAAKHRELTARQVKQSALVAARVIASEQDRVLENAHQFLVTLARVPQIRDNDKTSCRKILSALLEPRYADLIVADRNGNPLCTALPAGRSLASSKGLHHTRSVESYDFFVGNLRYHAASAKTLLDVSYPVSEQPGVVRAVVSAALDMSWINHVAVDSHLYPGVTFTLVSSAGTVLLRYPNGSDWRGKPIFAEAAEQSVASRDTEKTFEATGLDGVRRLFAFSRLKNPVGGQTVYAAIDLPTTVAFANTKEILIENLIALGVVSAIILCLAWFGTDFVIIRRIRDIIAATNEVAEGNLSARTTLAYDSNELGQMARAFDNLAYALEKREAEAVESTKQIHKQRQQQQALYDLNRGITSTLDVASVLRTLLDHISVLFPSCAVTVSWINKQTNDLEPIASRGLSETEQTQTDLVSAQLLPLLVLKQQSPLAISHVRTDPATINLEFFLRHKFTSYLGLPLVAKREILGVLSFYSREEREFSQEEINFLNALVHEATIAIYNSRLFEQTREQAIELEKSNKIKDEFLGVMSHELRTPLNIIMNYSEAIKMGTFGEISPEQERGTEKIRAQARHLLSLINGILEITKIESGTATVQADHLPIVDFMSETKSDYMLPMEKDVVLEWDYADDLPAIVSDRVKLKQILSNLINNAIKFTDQGHVRVSARVSAGGDTLELQVADTGTGIPNELLPFVFDKFRQIDSATTRNYGGAGLGLYIVKNFVDLLGGTIDARSEVGEGSVFTIRLPFQAERTPTELPRSQLKSASAHMT